MNDNSAKEKSFMLSNENITTFSSSDNVFVFLLDRLDYDYIEEVLNDDPTYFDELDGFTSYTNAIAEHARTLPGANYILNSSDEEIYNIPSNEYLDKAWTSNSKNMLSDLNDAGYDLVNNYEAVFTEFDEIVGLENIKVIHLNDSKNIVGAHKDRHENLGFGNLGFDTLIKVVYDERFKDIPKILETPYVGDFAPYKKEIEMIRNKEYNPNLKEELQ